MSTSQPAPGQVDELERLVFDGVRQVRCERVALPPVLDGQVRVRASYSLMSTGTENIVFNRLFEPGTHWDNWVRYPFYPGYTAVGEIEAVSLGVATWQPGDRVILRMSHASHAVVAADQCFPAPATVAPKLAPWAKLAQIAFTGAEAADYRLGDSALIIGAGPIGQMAVRWAVAAGCETVLVADAIAARRELALAGGAAATIQAALAESAEEVRAANHGELPRVVMDTTGNAAVLPLALGLAARFGKVVVLGDTGSPSEQRLTSDLVVRGVTIVGVHHTHGLPREAEVYRLFFRLLEAGRFPMDDLNTHTFQPGQCADAYALANRARGETMGIVFDWR